MPQINNTLQQKKVITVPYLPVTDTNRSVITNQLDALKTNNLNEICWDETNNVPNVKFVIAYNQEALFVKYYVSETYHRAVYTQPNDPVFKDSCVEFFIAVDEKGQYYNFEFNSLGTCLASYGKDRNNREKLDKEIISTINCWVEWKEFSPDINLYKWELTFSLTPSVFCYDQISSFSPGNFKANFYKCGDALAKPHYLAWNKILNPVPDFHQPDYFGLLTLQ